MNMKKRFTEEQIIPILKEAEAGLPAKELCRKFCRATQLHEPRYSVENDALAERIRKLVLERR